MGTNRLGREGVEMEMFVSVVGNKIFHGQVDFKSKNDLIIVQLPLSHKRNIHCYMNDRLANGRKSEG